MNFNSLPSGRIVIVGGGITGLSAAWEIRRHSPGSQISVLEQEDRWGGRILTHQFSAPKAGEFIAEAGPESFITRKPEVWDLVRELGMEDRIVNAGSETRGMYILEEGRIAELPLSPWKFLRSSLLSTRAKLRILLEPLVPRRSDNGDESMAAFFTRRMGREAFERIIGPVLAGIHSADPRTQSILSTFPILREMEREYGGLIPGAFARAKISRRKRRTLEESGRPVPPRFITFKSGSQELVETLVNHLRGPNTHLRLGTQVRRIQPSAPDQGFQLITSEGIIRADAVILALPANRAAPCIQTLAPRAASAMAAIRHSHIGTITLAFRTEDLTEQSLRMNGLMIPPRENRRIDAVTWTSNKMPPRAPQGCSLLRVFFGGNDSEMLALSDDELTQVVLNEIQWGLKPRPRPIDRRIYRAPSSFPQTDVGHLNRVREIETQLPGGLYAAGASYRGIGVPDCIRQGRRAAQKAIDHTARSLPPHPKESQSETQHQAQLKGATA